MYPCISDSKFIYCVPETMPLKLASLLMEYLQANKKLDLPGIGTFKKIESEDISFENNPSIKNVHDLIDFLSSKSGKMKALVAADLDSHLSLALEFLNIGKPFLFEGIGSLSKMKSGGFSFVVEKQTDHSAKELHKTPGSQESFTDYENVFLPRREKSSWKKPAVVFLLLAGFGAAIWLGYLAYKKRTANVTVAANKEPERILHTTSSVQNVDSSTIQFKAIDNDEYKFVLEVANERRAFERFDKLKSYGWNIKMETKDSLRYKLYLSLQLSLSDTTKVLDSLTALNGRRVYIEN